MSKEVKDFFTTYSDFVTKVTSEPSLDIDALKKSMDEIESSSDVKIPRLLTAALGLGSAALAIAAPFTGGATAGILAGLSTGTGFLSQLFK